MPATNDNPELRPIDRYQRVHRDGRPALDRYQRVHRDGRPALNGDAGLFGHQLASRDEAEIAWDVDIADLDYVRVSWTYEPTRARRPCYTHGHLIGWATLGPTARRPWGGMFVRRFFWLADHDRPYQPDGIYRIGAPSEGVDPRTIAPRVGGALTRRAWCGTAPIA